MWLIMTDQAMKEVVDRLDRIKVHETPSLLSTIDWEPFCWLLDRINRFAIKECASPYEGSCRFRLFARRYCSPEIRDTARELAVELTWYAVDIPPKSPVPRRNHQQLLKQYFGQYDLVLEQRWTCWVATIELVGENERPGFLFFDRRSCFEPPSSSSSSSSSSSDEEAESLVMSE